MVVWIAVVVWIASRAAVAVTEDSWRAEEAARIAEQATYSNRVSKLKERASRCATVAYIQYRIQDIQIGQ